jgi:7-carboxy-7-deazaguanine synthase
MTYSVKEIFYTLQGEGANAGRPAVFCRFSGCNLWNGREEDRSTAQCSFCDTDFVGTDGTGGGKFKNARDLANAIASQWPTTDRAHRFVVLTGGEPLLQVDSALTTALAEEGFFIAVETNGTVSPPPGLDWICVSPKAGTQIQIKAGNELKLVFPQIAFDPTGFEQLAFERFYLQPMDGPDQARNIAKAIDYCKAHPRWSLSFQTHKALGIR